MPSRYGIPISFRFAAIGVLSRECWDRLGLIFSHSLVELTTTTKTKTTTPLKQTSIYSVTEEGLAKCTLGGREMATRPQANGYICTNDVMHVRLLPKESAHTFTYPTVSYLLCLSMLEKGEFDLGRGWLFSYGGLSRRMTGIRASAYLQTGKPSDDNKSIKQKLLEVLQSHELDPELFHDAWMMTMPSYLGFEGINPLTVYFCYKNDQSLWVVVLEVHNTFGERHVYVLPVGPEYQDKKTQLGYKFSWTFARQFHVSPFNDRSGFYTCSIIPPPHPPVGPDTILSSNEIASDFGPAVHIDLHDSDPRTRASKKNGTKRVKLVAVLRPTSRRPFTSIYLLEVLANYPLDLFLSFPRIAYEAARLHYHKGLPVYGRPAPRAADMATERSLGISRNPIQEDKTKTQPSGNGVGWQPEGMLERYARHRVEDFLHARARELEMHIKLVYADPSFGTQTFRHSQASDSGCATLTIHIRSPQAFVFIFISPTPELALALGQESERQFTISDADLFATVFNFQPKTRGATVRVAILAQGIRHFSVPMTLVPSWTDTPRLHFLSSPFTTENRLVRMDRETRNVLALLLFYTLLYVEEFIFTILQAQFVVGDEPWGIWNRVADTVGSPSQL